MVFRMGLTYSEVEEILDTKCNATSTTGYTFKPRKFKISDFNLMLKSLIPDEVKVNITIDDIRLRSNLTSNETIRFTKKPLFYRFLGFIQSHSRVLSDFEAFVQLIQGAFKKR